jgi:hypothetical protein
MAFKLLLKERDYERLVVVTKNPGNLAYQSSEADLKKLG